MECCFSFIFFGIILLLVNWMLLVFFVLAVVYACNHEQLRQYFWTPWTCKSVEHCHKCSAWSLWGEDKAEGSKEHPCTLWPRLGLISWHCHSRCWEAQPVWHQEDPLTNVMEKTESLYDVQILYIPKLTKEEGIQEEHESPKYTSWILRWPNA